LEEISFEEAFQASEGMNMRERRQHPFAGLQPSQGPMRNAQVHEHNDRNQGRITPSFSPFQKHAPAVNLELFKMSQSYKAHDNLEKELNTTLDHNSSPISYIKSGINACQKLNNRVFREIRL